MFHTVRGEQRVGRGCCSSVRDGNNVMKKMKKVLMVVMMMGVMMTWTRRRRMVVVVVSCPQLQKRKQGVIFSLKRSSRLLEVPGLLFG